MNYACRSGTAEGHTPATTAPLHDFDLLSNAVSALSNAALRSVDVLVSGARVSGGRVRDDVGDCLLLLRCRQPFPAEVGLLVTPGFSISFVHSPYKQTPPAF